MNLIIQPDSPSKKKYLALKFITEASDLKSSPYIQKLAKHKLLKLLSKLATFDTDEADPFCRKLFKLKESDGEEYKYLFHILNLRYLKKWDTKFGVYPNHKPSAFRAIYQDLVEKKVDFTKASGKNDNLSFFSKILLQPCLND